MTISPSWTGAAKVPVTTILATNDDLAASTAHITWIASLDEATAPEMLAQFHDRIARPLGPYRNQVDVIDCTAGNGRIVLRLRWHAKGVVRDTLHRALSARVSTLPGSINFTVATSRES